MIKEAAAAVGSRASEDVRIGPVTDGASDNSRIPSIVVIIIVVIIVLRLQATDDEDSELSVWTSLSLDRSW